MESVSGPHYSGRVQKTICPAHVVDLVLRDHITAHATKLQCSYCTHDGLALPLELFMNAFMAGVYLHYEPTISPDHDPTDVIEYGDVVQAILEVAGITHRTLAADIVGALSVTPRWIPRDRRHGSPIEQLTYSWEAFKRIVKYEMRFFFAQRPTGSGDSGDLTAEQLLQAVSDVGQQTQKVWPVPCPQPIFRARMARSHSEASEWRTAGQLGSPPSEWAAPNRMSPAGISIFYGATDRATAIAEAGSHTSQRYVVTGEFTPTRPTQLIDLTNLPELPSIFDAGRRAQYFGFQFLQKFVHDVTLPVELDGHEHIDYVPTQVFTEYLRYAFPGAVDGLMFPSTQGPGHNVVMFFGPGSCADAGAETDRTRLRLDPDTVTVSRVMTVSR